MAENSTGKEPQSTSLHVVALYGAALFLSINVGFELLKKYREGVLDKVTPAAHLVSKRQRVHAPWSLTFDYRTLAALGSLRVDAF